MDVKIYNDKYELGKNAAKLGAEKIRAAIAAKGYANVILATGASQFEMLAALLEEKNIDWSVVKFFHLDEYVGLDINHPASFRKYLWERFIAKLPVPPAAFFPVNGTAADLPAALAELEKNITENPIDVAFVGIGENGHLAFNEPAEALEPLTHLTDLTPETIAANSRFFESEADVPKHAMTMGMGTILRSKKIIILINGKNKHEALMTMLKGDITTKCPATLLNLHADVTVLCDEEAYNG